MLKAEMETSVRWLIKLYDITWEAEKTAKEWARGIITKIPKKENLTTCKNWRGCQSSPLDTTCTYSLYEIESIKQSIKQSLYGDFDITRITRTVRN